jgi:membrane protein insertase Oxa1/YidC/SpoIIIJ
MRINMKIMWWTRPSTPTVPGADVPDMTKMMDFMNIFLVIMITSFVYSVATGVGLYIVTSTLVWVIQTWYQNRILINAKLQTLFKKS